MSDDLNPYAPPQSATATAPADAGIPDGDLDAALAGQRPLALSEVFTDAWRLVHGMKRSTAVATMAVGVVFIPLIGLLFGTLFLYAGIGLDILASPVELEATMAQLTQDPIYHLLAGLLSIPTSALSYMSLSNIGLRRAAGHDIRVRDAFPMQGLLKASTLLLLLWPLGSFNAIYPLAGFLTLPLYLCMFWAPAVLLDREDCSIFEAVKISARLVRHTWMFLLVNVAIVIVGYIGLVCSLGIAFFWFLPWVSCVYGVAWRRLAGLQSPRLTQP